MNGTRRRGERIDGARVRGGGPTREKVMIAEGGGRGVAESGKGSRERAGVAQARRGEREGGGAKVVTTGAATTTTHAVPAGLAQAGKRGGPLKYGRAGCREARRPSRRRGPPTLWPRRLPRPQSASRRADWAAPLACRAPSVATTATLHAAPLSLLNVFGGGTLAACFGRR